MKPLSPKWTCLVLLAIMSHDAVIQSKRAIDDVPSIPVGLVLHEDLEDLKDAQTSFKYATRELRRQRPEPLNIKFNNTLSQTINFNNSFKLMKTVCSMLSSGVFSLIVHGPATSYEVINSLSNKMKIPTFFPTGTGNTPANRNSFVINMMPSYTRAMVDLINFFRWDTVYYLFDSKEGLIRLQDLYKASGNNEFRFTIRPRRISNISDCYELLRTLDRQNDFKYRDGIRFKFATRIILDLSSKAAYNQTLEQIINVGMNRENYHYILGGLGITEDRQYLESFEYGGVNITGFSVINRATEHYTYRRQNNRDLQPIRTYKQALMRDTVKFIAKGYQKLKKQADRQLQNMYRYGKIWNGDTPGVNCSGLPWNLGERVNKIYKESRMEGFSGTVAFDSNGLRKDYTLEVHQLEYRRPLRKIGTWSSNGPTLRDRFQTNLQYPVETVRNESSANRTLRIVTIEDAPFVKKVESEPENGEHTGYLINGTRYEGYCIDLVDRVQKRYKVMFKQEFNYEIHLVHDRQFGKVNKTDGKWNGMIGELIYGQADMAIASLTINKERERAVDFTKPFMNMGVSIMIKKPDKQKPGVFSFMYPLSNEVWICVMVAFLAVSFVLFFVGRWSPYEWQTISSPKEESTTNAFTFSNTLWFALGALMQQGSDIFPRSFSGRVVGSAWWFFTLILISSYTANLAAFLTIERLLTPIKSADDLVEQSDIAYGTYRGGATQRFFEQSQVLIYQRMWDYMKANWDSVMMDSNPDGIKKVKNSKGKYAFLCESPLNEYENQKKPCDTMKVGDNLDSKGYGIATPLHSEYRKNLNLVVLKLREEGELHKLLQRWWYDKGECGTADSTDSVKSALTLSNVSGIFHILISGLVLSMIVALLEFLIHRERKQNKKQQTAYKPAVKIVKKDPLEVLKAAGYTEQENSGYTYNSPDHMKSFENTYSPKPSHSAI